MATSTSQVFETTELMEQILLKLGVRDVLIAMKVNRKMRDTVLCSAAIKQSIGLLPDHDVNFRTLLWQLPAVSAQIFSATWLAKRCLQRSWQGLIGDRLPAVDILDYTDFDLPPGFSFSSFTSPADPCTVHAVSFKFFEDGPDDCYAIPDFESQSDRIGSLYRLGSRVQALSITQPPTDRLTVKVSCRECDIRAPPGHRHVSPSNGQYITFGDLYRAYLRFRTKHRQNCQSIEKWSELVIEFAGSGE